MEPSLLTNACGCPICQPWHPPRPPALHPYVVTYTYTAQLVDGTQRPATSCGRVEAQSPRHAHQQFLALGHALGHADVTMVTLTLAPVQG